MSFSIQTLVLVFISVQVGGEVDDVETVKVKEGGFLRLDPGLHDLKGSVQILWTFESPGQSTRVAQMHHGKIYTHYDERLTGRVQMERETGTLTLTDIRTSESGLYKAVIIANKKLSVQKYRVDVYGDVHVSSRPKALVSVPAIRSSAVTVHSSTDMARESGTSQKPQTSDSNTRPQTTPFCPNNQDSEESCGEDELLIRLVLSGLVGIATVGVLLEHMRCCAARGRAQSPA